MRRTVSRLVLIVVTVGLGALLTSCGGSNNLADSSAAQSNAISISPSGAALAPGQSVQFAASGSGASGGVTWLVNGVAGGSSSFGTIDSSGLYVAPKVSSSTSTPLLVQATANSSFSPASPVWVLQGTVSGTQNPLVAQYSLNVPAGSSVQVQFGLDTNYGLTTWSQPGSGTVNVLVAGMKAGTTYHMRASAQLSGGLEFTDVDHTFTTGTAILPSYSPVSPPLLPNLTLTADPALKPSPGIEMFELVPEAVYQVSLVATDLSGNVIWYYNSPFGFLPPNPAKLLPDGNIFVDYSGQPDGAGSVMEEIDLAGNVKWSMTAAQLNQALAAAGQNLTVIGTHHDVAILPNGHLIVLASTNKDFTDLPGYPGTTTVTGDVLIDLDENRNPVWVWSHWRLISFNS